MTLCVDLFDPAPGGAPYLNRIEPDLAGLEVDRHRLWGADVVVGLGATFLPRLREDNLLVFPDELDAFEAECRLLMARRVWICEQLSLSTLSPQRLADYLQNILSAIAHARRENLGVHIS